MAPQTPEPAASTTKQAKPTEATKNGEKSRAREAQTKVDDASDQTFPASDAPASWAGKDIAPQDRPDAHKKD